MIAMKKALPRRTVLRGLGATIALPLLDGMVPAFAALRTTAAQPVRRFAALYVGMGMDMAGWTPSDEGALTLSPILAPLAPFRDRLLVVSGLDNKEGEVKDGGPHPAAQTSWLTGARAKRTEGPDLRAGISLDQIVAQEFGQETQLTSLELAIESVGLLGSCSQGYSCAYNNTIAWRTATTPLPMENNPRAVFERLFGASDSTDAASRLADLEQDRSILDSVTEKVGHLQRRLGPNDGTKLTQYLDAIRDVERRIQKAEEQAAKGLPVVEAPVGIPTNYDEHAKLLLDLLLIAYQADLTRVFTFLLAREASVRAYPEIGISEPHHPLSHHGNNPEKLAGLRKLNIFHISMLAYLLENLQSMPDGDGTMLDHTMLLYGSGLSNPSQHIPLDVPVLVVGGQTARIAGRRHITCAKGTPLANLQLTLLDRMGCPMERFGDSTGELHLVSAV